MKLLIARTVVPALLGIVSGTAWGANATACAHASDNASFKRNGSCDLTLGSSVTQICTIAVRPTAKASSLDIKAGEQNVTVGEVTEDCNSSTGYTVSIASQNGGQLRTVADDANAPQTAYTASYDDATGSIASGITATRNGAFFGRLGNLSISIPANAKAVAGNYSDNITLVIAAK